MLPRIILANLLSITSLIFNTVQSKNIVDIKKGLIKKETDLNIKFTDNIHERLVYFSQASSLSSCITDDQLTPGYSLNEGGCPSKIKFCHTKEINPTCDSTKLVTVLEANKGELGTGYVMVDFSKKVVVVAFRSSTTSQDWFCDFTIQPTEYLPASQEEYWTLVKKGEISECKDCKIHKGVSKFSESLGKDFLEKIECILEKFPTFKTVITGHSLGAALASMVGIELRLKGFYPIVLTYAPPKIFNSNMREWVDELFETEDIHNEILRTKEIQFEKGLFRVVHKNDYIPLLPPFYSVSGLEIFIEKIELPHEKEDLCYYGRAQDIAAREVDTKDFSGPVDRLLHTYEHRAYFIELNGCKGF